MRLTCEARAAKAAWRGVVLGRAKRAAQTVTKGKTG